MFGTLLSPSLNWESVVYGSHQHSGTVRIAPRIGFSHGLCGLGPKP